MIAKGFAGLLAVLISSAAWAGVYDHNIYRIMNEAAADECDDMIAAIADRFAEDAGVEIIAAGCFANEFDFDQLDGVITYDAEERVEISKRIEIGTSGAEQTYLYREVEACEEDLPSQVEMFEAQTGLYAFASFCRSNNSSVEERWELQIEAVGFSEYRHYFTGVNLWGTPLDGVEEYWAEIRTGFEDRGFVLSQADFISNLFYHRLTVSYYSNSRAYLYANSEVQLLDEDTCRAAEERAETAFGELDVPPIAIFCDQATSGPYGLRLNIYTLEDTNSDPAEYNYRILPGRYETLDECYDAREDRIERLERGGTYVIEAFCGTNESDRIVLHAFLRTTK